MEQAPSGGFEAFALSPELLSVLKELGYEEPTPIQRETIPHMLAGRDVLGQAATGTGKTAAFALPLVERLEATPREPFTTRALVLVPTRELAMQVAEAIRSYGKKRNLQVAAVFGGQEMYHQIKLLKVGVDVVVATPGRTLDHIGRKTLKLGQVRFVVLDEADEMLDMGFAEDLEKILAELPENRQTALFSATLPARIATIANQHLKNPVKVTIAPRSVDAGTLPKIRQAAYVVRRDQKEAALIRLLDVENPVSAIIFCRTRIEVEGLSESLGRRGLLVSALHGGMTQEQRDLVLKRFKGGALKILIATDVAARGLHVENLSHVINYDLPVSPEPYVHRIGRTGRAGREGVALSLLDPRELRLLKNIERTTRTRIPQEPLPGAEVLRERRESVLAELVKTALEPATAEKMKRLFAQLSEGGAVPELVAQAALVVAMERLFPPTEGDDVDFEVKKAAPRRTGEEASADRAPPRASAPRRSATSAERPPREDGPRRPPMTDGVWLFVTLGKRAGLRPQDLVGAIANEAGVSSNQIGQIEIADENSRVEVPRELAPQIISVLKKSTLRGRRFNIDLDRTRAGVDAAPSAPAGFRERPNFEGAPGGFDRPARAGGKPYGKPAGEKRFDRAGSKPGFSKPAGKPAEGATFGKPAERSSFGKPSDRPSFGRPSDRPSFGKPSDRPSSGKPSERPSFGKPSERPSFGKPSDRSASFGKPAGRPSFGKPSDRSASFGKPAGKPAYGRPSDRTPAKK
jgi:ATP-dependent RNA helicase DeaD